jgi:hypothetical protein
VFDGQCFLDDWFEEEDKSPEQWPILLILDIAPSLTQQLQQVIESMRKVFVDSFWV